MGFWQISGRQLQQQLPAWIDAAKVRIFTTFSRQPFKFCVVGTGPAGMYTADRILKRFNKHEVEIDFIEKMPSPFGLVSMGVAPDHQDTKKVTSGFRSILDSDACEFFGNVGLGTDLSLRELRDLYDGVVLAYGAQGDRDLGIPGENQDGVLSARKFVCWYNGHPDFVDLQLDLSKAQNVVVFGMGNVAIDCARILLKNPDDLEKTDISEHALQALKKSKVRNVYIIGRRGPAHAKFTPKELRELVLMDDVHVDISLDDLRLDKLDREAIKTIRLKKRIMQILTGARKTGTDKAGMGLHESKYLKLQFYRRPRRIIPKYESENSKFEMLTEHMKLQEPPEGQPLTNRPVVGTGRIDGFPADLVLKSVGYLAEQADPEIPFDDENQTVPNVDGRVVQKVDQDEVVNGLYVCGWLKRGSSGIIGTNLVDAEETVDCMFSDREEMRADGRKAGRNGLKELLKLRGVRYVDLIAWKRLDDYELQRGIECGRPRVKVVDKEKILDICHQRPNLTFDSILERMQ